MTKPRRTEVYCIYLYNNRNEEVLLSHQLDLKNIINSFFRSSCINNIKYKINRLDMTYFFETSNIIYEENKLKVQATYAKSNKRIPIIDVNTLATISEKNKNQGDKEKQHFIIKFFPEYNQAIMTFEKIQGGISIGALKEEIDLFFKNNFQNQFSNNSELHIKPTPSAEFLSDLENMKKISTVKIIADKTVISPEINSAFSGEGNSSRDTTEIIYRPTYRSSFSKSQIRSLFNSYNCEGSRIIRIKVEGSGENGTIRLDTIGSKMAEYLNISLDIDGLIDTSDILTKFDNYIDDIPEEILGIVFDEVACCIE